jgi:hypothetical protein
LYGRWDELRRSMRGQTRRHLLVPEQRDHLRGIESMHGRHDSWRGGLRWWRALRLVRSHVMSQWLQCRGDRLLDLRCQQRGLQRRLLLRWPSMLQWGLCQCEFKPADVRKLVYALSNPAPRDRHLYLGHLRNGLRGRRT